MKKINRNTEKRQRVRVLETGELGTVTDQQLILRQGRLHVYRQVRLDKKPHLDRWFWDDQLGATKEQIRVTFEDGRGNHWVVGIVRDHEQGHQTVSLQGGTLNKLYPLDYSVHLTRILLDGMGILPDDFVEHLKRGCCPVLAPPRRTR